MTLHAYYRQSFNRWAFLYIVLHLVTTLVALIYNMVYWNAKIKASVLLDEELDYGLEVHVIWVGVLGIVLVLMAFIGMALSQSVFFLILGIYIECADVFVIVLALIHNNSQFFLILIVAVLVSSFLAGPVFQASRYTKSIRRLYEERTVSSFKN
eukprot:CAMPEP_0202704792 /NCGR_PEP_ID=MMETSP1385-20130828/17427_1 /ASSEMBLY_ACC=CAM_ASM_000861 /TAXON_ID=933848 /ORGANISM="Elphidium margaritaceum" /LENGTH=153 /DNA_ID=CAMNT_0049362897 /DNA_START=116 /DNA_END=577 /DNA_ORIENTATION=+